ncbi:MAG: endopeptidase La [Clostridiales Family XIII bacterium]|jgi:ATP-dependent Lon protease|nr:endopeptidase La [Clostridiales Family XIII bacterium]
MSENNKDKEKGSGLQDDPGTSGVMGTEIRPGAREWVIPVIPLRGLTAFPYLVFHFDIGREKSINALEKAMIANQMVFLVSQKNPETELPMTEDCYDIGCISKIKQMLRLPGGDSIRVLVEGVSRGRALQTVAEVPCLEARIEEIPEEDFSEEIPPRVEALLRMVMGSFNEYLEAGGKGTDAFSAVELVDQPGRIADIITSNMDIKTEQKQKILEAFPVEERLSILGDTINKEIEIEKIEQDINRKVRSKINRNQKEFFLREQLKTIKEELGVEEDFDDEIADWLKKLKKLGIPEKVEEKAEKEIKRLSKMQPGSAEATVIRSYVEWVFDLPWNKYSSNEIDLKTAAKKLDEDHYGLGKVKDRILEYFAVMSLAKDLKAPILCLVGPPGVGKTSIAKSIADAMGRSFVRLSLGGVRDEAEIRGHRRTYIGSIPGRIINGMKEAKTMNPLFLFDEIDKLGNDFRGDPASALLEVLDPEQNKDFTDHYLEFPFDLSKVLFLTTANNLDTIPRPLLDRMEVIQVPGYTELEKVKIAERHLIPKQRELHGLTPETFAMTGGALKDIISYYTRESGVRTLERNIGSVCRKAARKIVEGRNKQVRVTSGNIENFLGKKVYRYDIIENEQLVGITTGLAWTSVGGTTLSIETMKVAGKGSVVLTGQLGDVMQESAKAGISYIRSIAEELGIEKDFYNKYDIHLHVPEGATPKDGPSAGVTMCVAMISMLTGIPARQSVAMTGEITLRGKVLPVGGVREKLLAAHRAGITKALIPADNEADLDEIPAEVKKKMEFVLLGHVKDALPHVLASMPTGKKKPGAKTGK